MRKLASVKCKLSKYINKGDQESLQTLFRSAERYRRMVLLASAEEGTNIRAILRGLGTVNLKLGDDMERGEIKSIMTLFWFEERAKLIEIKKKASAGKAVTIDMMITPRMPATG